MDEYKEVCQLQNNVKGLLMIIDIIIDKLGKFVP